jgi:hypothetical protein
VPPLWLAITMVCMGAIYTIMPITATASMYAIYPMVLIIPMVTIGSILKIMTIVNMAYMVTTVGIATK